MSSRRSKRTNPGAADEPAAKRTATEENGIAKNKDNSIQRAQAALDRLDFKTGVEMCTQMIDSNPFDVIQPLLLRSVGLERLGQVHKAAKDVEKALKTKKTRETHLRATFNFLALALHHLEIAQQLPPQEEEPTISPLKDSGLVELKQEMEKSKNRQLKSPFDRLSPELFVKTMSLNDSPSLLIGTSVCKSWNKSILEAQSLFRHFEMEGKVSNIMKGIKTFGEKSSNSLKSIDLKIKEEVNDSEKEQLHNLILPSSGSLQSLSVAHNGELCPFIVGIASQCPSLTVLSSTDIVANAGFPSPRSEIIPFVTSWKPKLRILVWNGGAESLLCDDALVERLQEATDVTICSDEIGSNFIVKLLSSNTSLVHLEIPWTEGDEVQGMGSISFDLPYLKYLRLEQIPESTEDANCSLFFKNFKAPSLWQLYLEKVNPKDLSFLRAQSSPQTFNVDSLLVEPTEEAATSLIEAMKDWEHLHSLHLLLPMSTPSGFWNRLVRLLSIQSREAVEAGYKDHFVFPELKKVIYGTQNKEAEEPTGSAISATALASMVSSRMAVHRALSWRDVFLSASGEFGSALSPPSGQDVAFASLQTSLVEHIQTSLVEHIEVNVPLTSEESAISWLQNNVRNFRNNCK